MQPVWGFEKVAVIIITCILLSGYQRTTCSVVPVSKNALKRLHGQMQQLFYKFDSGTSSYVPSSPIRF